MKALLLKEAEDEAQEAAHWYETRQEGLGEEFLQELSRALETIEQHPERQLRIGDVPSDREVRRFLLERFPYKVVFEVRSEELLVIAVSHVRRKPMYWKDRGEVDN